MTAPAHDAEVIIIGAGPAGCAAAIPLVQRGHKVLVLERRSAADEGSWEIQSGELLAPMTQIACAELGVPMQGSWVLDQTTGVRNVYPDLSWTYHELPTGITYQNVDRGGLNAALRARLQAVGGEVRFGTRVKDAQLLADAAVVRSTDGEELKAKLLIDAGGRHAPAVRAFRLKDEDPEFNQIAVALFFRELPDAAVGFWDRHFYGEHGAMISGARIRPGLFRLVLEADLADQRAHRLPVVEFFERIAERYDPWVHERLRQGVRVGEPWAMAPLAFRVTAVALDRLLLAGDAAGYLSPLSGQGVEVALRTGRLAAEAAHSALASGDYSAGAFQGYIEGRRAELDGILGYLRHMLRHLRDREALIRASTDDTLRGEIFGALFATVSDRGSLPT